MTAEFVLQTVMGPTVVALLAWMVSAVRHRGSAAARHATWVVALVGFGLMPLVCLTMAALELDAYPVPVALPVALPQLCSCPRLGTTLSESLRPVRQVFGRCRGAVLVLPSVPWAPPWATRRRPPDQDGYREYVIAEF